MSGLDIICRECVSGWGDMPPTYSRMPLQYSFLEKPQVSQVRKTHDTTSTYAYPGKVFESHAQHLTNNSSVSSFSHGGLLLNFTNIPTSLPAAMHSSRCFWAAETQAISNVLMCFKCISRRIWVMTSTYQQPCRAGSQAHTPRPRPMRCT